MKRKVYLTSIILGFSMVLMGGCGISNSTDNDTQEIVENVIEEENTESFETITDFTIKLEKQTNVTNIENPIEMNSNGNYYKLSFNHEDEIYEINFFKIASKNNTSINNREYIGSYYSYMPMDSVYLIYDNEKENNFIISFTAKNNQLFEYILGEEEKLIPLENPESELIILK